MKTPRTQTAVWRIAWALSLLLLPALACSLPSLPSLPDLGGTPVPLPTPTPLGDTLTYQLTNFSAALDPGDAVPGTRLVYVGPNNGAYDVLIDGQPATRRVGDSFPWSGVVAPGVSGRFGLRLSAPPFGKLMAAGPVALTIYNPNPVQLQETAVATALRFPAIPIDYRVGEGGTIPGTTLLYTGYVDPNSSGGPQVAERMAQLAGGSGYPFVAQGDSLVWFGQLRSGVFIRYDLRVSSIDQNGLRVLGTAELWIQTP